MNDLISREQANDALEKLCEKQHFAYGGDDVGTMGYDLAHVFDDLPSISMEISSTQVDGITPTVINEDQEENQ